MQRYFLFAGLQCYPAGGFKDFVGSFDTVIAAVLKVADLGVDAEWWHVVDACSGEIVRSEKS